MAQESMAPESYQAYLAFQDRLHNPEKYRSKPRPAVQRELPKGCPSTVGFPDVTALAPSPPDMPVLTSHQPQAQQASPAPAKGKVQTAQAFEPSAKQGRAASEEAEDKDRLGSELYALLGFAAPATQHKEPDAISTGPRASESVDDAALPPVTPPLEGAASLPELSLGLGGCFEEDSTWTYSRPSRPVCSPAPRQDDGARTAARDQQRAQAAASASRAGREACLEAPQPDARWLLGVLQQGVKQACNLVSLHQHLGSSSTRVKTLQLLGMRLFELLYGPHQLQLEQCVAALESDRDAVKAVLGDTALVDIVLACCHAEVNKTSAATIHKRLMLLSWRLQRAAALNGPASC